MSDLKYNLFEDLKITHIKCKEYSVTPHRKGHAYIFPCGTWVS